MNSNDISKIIDYLENLKSEDVKKRLISVENLHKIANVFGPEKTRLKLLPFLKEFKDDEEQILLALAKQLKNIGLKICEKENHLTDIIPYFYLCFNYEDLSVINEALKSLKFLLTKMDFKHESIIALAKKLFQTDFTKSIVSSIKIATELSDFIPLKYAGEMNKIITESTISKIVIIRNHAAKGVRHILKENGSFNPLALKIVKILIKDSQDIVKVSVSESLCYSKHSKSFFNNNLANIILPLFEEKSWRVKFALVRGLENILSSVQNNTKKEILKYFLSYLQDPEIEVTIEAYKILKKIHYLLDPDFIIDKILRNVLSALEQDLEIKKAAASTLPYLSKTLGRINTNKHLKEIITDFLKQKDSSIQSAIFQNLEPLTSTIPLEDILSIINPILLKLLNDKNWNIRKNAIKTYQILLVKGEKDENIIKAIRTKLSDRVYEVRKTAIQMLANVSEKLGSEFAENYALPIFYSFYANSNYLYRLNYIFGLGKIFEILSLKTQDKEILNVVRMAKDKVANVKLNVVLFLLRVYVVRESEALKESICKILNGFKKNEDHDLTQIAKKLNGHNFKLNIDKILYNY